VLLTKATLLTVTPVPLTPTVEPEVKLVPVKARYKENATYTPPDGPHFPDFPPVA
jgi:hypothetical protein